MAEPSALPMQILGTLLLVAPLLLVWAVIAFASRRVPEPEEAPGPDGPA